jgi:hypothetical protein
MSFTLEQLGNSFISKEGELDQKNLEEFPLVGLYFGADWAKPCQSFLPTLIEFYNLHN